MRSCFLLFCISILIFSCNEVENESFHEIEFNVVFEQPDSIQSSFRALDVLGDEVLIGGNLNQVYQYGFESNQLRQLLISDSSKLEFRSVAQTEEFLFALSIGSPAKIYRWAKSDLNSVGELVYTETGETVFYDSMKFWNNQEGIAFGDSVDGCLSVLITRNAGQTWAKVACSALPSSRKSEGAFAASNTNIELKGNHTWLASGTRIFYSSDKGNTWQAISTPIIQEESTQGIYSIDFYNNKQGVAVGGDYTQPNQNQKNLIATEDGGKTWVDLSSSISPGYRSCIQYLPNSKGEAMLAVGFKGIDYTSDGGKTWNHLSDESYYSVRFINNREGILVGKGRITQFRLN